MESTVPRDETQSEEKQRDKIDADTFDDQNDRTHVYSPDKVHGDAVDDQSDINNSDFRVGLPSSISGVLEDAKGAEEAAFPAYVPQPLPSSRAIGDIISPSITRFSSTELALCSEVALANAKTVPQQENSLETGTVDEGHTSANPAIQSAKRVTFATDSSSLRLAAPTVYNSTPHISNRMKGIAVVLRLGAVCLALISFIVMVSNNEERATASNTFIISFKDFQAYSYLVAANAIYFVYSVWHLLQLWRESAQGVLSTSLKSQIRVCILDQVQALLLLSASSSAATSARLSRIGLPNIWAPACSAWRLQVFCSKADAAVAMSFFSSFLAVSSFIVSTYQLFKSLEY